MLPICATGCHTDGLGMEGKGSCGWLPGVVIKNPTLCHLYWNREVMNEVRG